MLNIECLPERIRVMDTELEPSKGLRKLLVANYYVFYVIGQDM